MSGHASPSRWPRIATAILLAVSAIAFPPTALGQAATECRDWVHTGAADTRFKVWACKGTDPDKAAQDRDRVAALVEEIWGPLTQPVPTGLGPPLPDAVGTNVDLEHGLDGRIDFYALLPGQGVYRGGKVRSITSKAAAAAGVSLLAESARGANPNGASGYVLVDRSRLGDDVEMRLDLIHEFFHVLQYAHNGYAPLADPSHWFVEASAVWAETWYQRQHSDIPHGWFEDFQTSTAGLEDPDILHGYSAYIWPFFMEQEVGRDAIMQAWAGIGALPSGSDYVAVTDVIDAQLPFAEHFQDFAIRNLNNDALEDADPREPMYHDLDPAFHEDVQPGHMRSGSVAPGSPYVEQLSMPPLAARYADVSFDDEARWVTISVTGLSAQAAVKADAIVHISEGWWERRPFEGGILRFCRDEDEPFNDVDRAYVVISNHDRRQAVSGPLEVSARDACADDAIVLEGTVRGTEWSRADGVWRQTSSSTEGSMSVTMRIEPDDWTTEVHARISGEYTGDCEYQDSDSGSFTGTMSDPGAAEDGQMFGSVTIDGWDPGYRERPLDRLIIHPFMVIRRWGGTCGHIHPPVQEAFPELMVSLASCDIELTRDGASWSGGCRQGDDEIGHEWTADFLQVQPPPEP